MVKDELIGKMMEETLGEKSDGSLEFDVRRLCAKKGAKAIAGTEAVTGLVRFKFEGLEFDVTRTHLEKFKTQLEDVLGDFSGHPIELEVVSNPAQATLVYWPREQRALAA